MKVFIKNYGCSANINDGEIMQGLLSESGRLVVDSVEESDAIVLNTCTVKGKVESEIKREIKRIQTEFPSKKLVIAGCMPQVQSGMLHELAPESALIGPHQIDEIVGAFENKNAFVRIDKKAQVKANLPKLRKNPLVNIVQINEGCVGSCTFCITKLAKPKLLSFPMAQIRADIEKGIKDGCKEVWLTSQDTAAYGKENRRNLPMLLDEVLSVEGDFMFRIGMMNPDNIIGIEEELVSRIKHPKVFKFIHIPLQSGSDDILKRMKREYTVEDFKKIVAKIRKEIPEISIATDIICGFPGETEYQFEETLRLVHEMKFDVINVSRYWERPGTASAKMDGKLNGRITKERSTRLMQLFREVAKERNDAWINWEGEILIDEKGTLEATWSGRNYAYKPVIVKSAENIFGKNLRVKITAATSFDLRGEEITQLQPINEEVLLRITS
ncbi:MAG: tRNA (N(6)-L-threonylcarbamoyladenosine(37)-C(2))-methylthiotransferase [Nanoarchaeota archaeon]